MADSNDKAGPAGALGSLAMAHTLALATLIDILIREKIIDAGEITRAYAKLAKDLRKNKRLGVTGAKSLEQIVQMVRASRQTAGRA
jgi:hypothetical protein